MRGITGVTWHWTAGASGLNDKEEDSYNEIVQMDGSWAPGQFPVTAQIAPIRPGRYAAHTLNANTGRIGIACDAMFGMTERPLSWGKYPLTEAGIRTMLERTAHYCREWDIPVSRTTTLSHAEVQPTLGIKQNGKIDFIVLPGMTRVDDPVVVGDELRRQLLEIMGDLPATPAPAKAPPQAVTMVLLRPGDFGSQVILLQKALLAAGFAPGVVDGSYGRRTTAAVANYQAYKGLTQDGVAGPKTLAALGFKV